MSGQAALHRLRAAGLFALLAVAPACGPRLPESLGRLEPAEPEDLAAVAADFRARAGRVLTVRGEITEVCRLAGCWLELADRDQRLHIELLGFTVPEAARGRWCRTQGKLVEQQGRWTLLARGIAFER